MKLKFLATLLPLAMMAGGWIYLQSTSTSVDDLSVKSKEEIPTVGPETEGTYEFSDNTRNHRHSEDSVRTSKVTSFENKSKVDITSVGLSPLSDEEFTTLQSQLQADDTLLDTLLDEFRYNTNPQRARQIAALLGEHNHQKVVDAAAGLVYSGDPVSKKMGLDLLSRLQPINSQARDIAIELLSAEDDPLLLVSTMNVLATPSPSATSQQRNALLDNTTILATHRDPQVRSHSVALIGRWSKNTGVDTLTTAMTDIHPQVRARAVSALRGLPNPERNVIDGLFQIAENSDEEKVTRQSSLYALKDMLQTDEDRQRYRLAQLSVRTRQPLNQ